MASSGASREKGADTHTGCASPWAAVTFTWDLPAPRGAQWVPRAGAQLPPRGPSGLRYSPWGCKPGRSAGQEDALGRRVPGRSGAQRDGAARGGGPFK